MFNWIQPGTRVKINPFLLDPAKCSRSDMDGYTAEMRFIVIGLVKEKRELHDYSPVVVRCLEDGELYVMPVMDIMPENGWPKK